MYYTATQHNWTFGTILWDIYSEILARISHAIDNMDIFYYCNESPYYNLHALFFTQIHSRDTTLVMRPGDLSISTYVNWLPRRTSS